jgi:hypothetical protein
MTFPLRYFVFVAVASLFFGALCGWSGYRFLGTNTLVQAPAVNIFNSTPTDREMEKELVRMDIEEAGNRVGLSARQQAQYLDYLDEAATKYTIPMILVHSIVYVESSYDPSARHPQIVVRGTPTFAIGFGGVVWEYNKDALIKEGIATARLELTEPRSNLLATAFIIHRDVEEIFAKNPTLSEDRFFDELIRKYYGGYDEPYKVRMLAKIKDMASRQWIHRVVKTILLKYKTELPKPIAHNDSSQVGKTFSSIGHTTGLYKTAISMHSSHAVGKIDISHTEIVTTPIKTLTPGTLVGLIAAVIN